MHQKSQLLLNRKAFMQIDFAFAVLTFMVLFFVVFQFLDSYNINNRNDITSNIYLADSIDICNLLITTPGYPRYWENNLSSVVFIGMKNITSNSLDSEKISMFTTDNYLNLTDTLNFNETKFINIKIIGMKSNNTYLDFGNVSRVRDFSTYNCYSYYNNESVKVQVEVWK